jgi:Carboxypeptidase regulatory-like domain
VTITDSNVENLSLTIATPSLISGRVRVEGTLPSTTPMERLRVTLTPVPPGDSSGISSRSATVSADATFKMNAAQEGEFRVVMPNLPVGFYLKEARLNDVSILDTPSRFSASGNLEILLSANTGQVSGRVLNAQSKPVAGIVVVLIPNLPRERPELYKRATTDLEGRFTVSSVAPGAYKAFAWERIEANSYFDPDILMKYEQLGTPVQVMESSRETIDVRLIPEGNSP